MAETMDQYLSKTRADYGSRVARPKIEEKDSFELKGQFLKELRSNTFSGSDHEDANEHIKKVLEIVDLFHIPNITIDQVMLRAFPMSLTGAASKWLRNKPTGSITNWEDLKAKFLSKYCLPAHTAKKMEEINNFQQEPDENLYQTWERFKELRIKGAIPSKTVADAKVAIQEMVEYSQKWDNGTSRARSTETSDGLAAIQAQLNNLGREIKKVSEKVYVAQSNSFRFLPKEQHESFIPRTEAINGRYLEQIYGTNLIKEIRASTDAAIRNQGASIKTLEIQIGQMSKLMKARYAVLDPINMSYPLDRTVDVVVHTFPKDPNEAIRRAYLVGTDTEFEPFKDPVETEAPESPHSVAPPTSLPDSIPPTLIPIIRKTAHMAVHVPPAMSSGLSAVDDIKYRLFYSIEEENEEEEDEEIKESLNFNSESEDTEDEGPTIEDEDPAIGDEGLAARDESPAMGEPLGLGYRALRRREIALEEGQKPSVFEVAPSIVPSPISSPMIPLTVPSPIALPVTDETEGFLTQIGARVEMQGGLIRDHTIRLEEISPTLFDRYDRDIRELFTRSGAVRDEIFS
ncbi:hypothetical protein Tco_1122219 [Tanacetum coccineum]|uniref:Retrotransposon gag domain-containing protein n=1 Tax=Tanacetum coccineum TaxID=301880 RepID=A0ABQ5J3P7_9ASTR